MRGPFHINLFPSCGERSYRHLRFGIDTTSTQTTTFLISDVK